MLASFGLARGDREEGLYIPRRDRIPGCVVETDESLPLTDEPGTGRFTFRDESALFEIQLPAWASETAPRALSGAMLFQD